jgi:hypothetical protein
MEQTGTGRSMEDPGSDILSKLEKLKREVYNDSNDDLALGLGRPTEEITAWFDGSEEIDEDAEMKILRLSEERIGEEGDPSGPEAADDPELSSDQRI